MRTHGRHQAQQPGRTAERPQVPSGSFSASLAIVATLLDRTLSDAEILALHLCCDAYVALHRSEGYGFGLAEEPRSLKRRCSPPAYSGNLDFYERRLLVPAGLSAGAGPRRRLSARCGAVSGRNRTCGRPPRSWFDWSTIPIWAGRWARRRAATSVHTLRHRAIGLRHAARLAAVAAAWQRNGSREGAGVAISASPLQPERSLREQQSRIDRAGVTGQDGAHLAHSLLPTGYVGPRHVALTPQWRGWTVSTLDIRDKVELHSMSLVDFQSRRMHRARCAGGVYHLAGQSSVALSLSQPAETLKRSPADLSQHAGIHSARRRAARFYYSGSSECFGDTGQGPANELTAFRPKQPAWRRQGGGHPAGRQLPRIVRSVRLLGPLDNHGSPLRRPDFVTRKITSAAARIAHGSGERLSLGDLSIRRDWGWAPEYVETMWAMLRQPTPDDSRHRHRRRAFARGIRRGGFRETSSDWRDHVDIDRSLMRPSDIACSLGDAGKAARVLDWRPQVGFSEIVARMVRAPQ